MNVFLWTVAGLLALVFGAAGAMKLGRTGQQPAASGLGWTADAGDGTVRLIGAAGVAGALGLILPALLDTAEVPVAAAARGLAVLMAGAAVVHGRRKEPQMIAVNAILFALTVVVAWGRLGPYAF
ncbi:DoxX family protein [Streptomyces sp. NPDC002922]|uniref:DoxX family protein n=1 Tax=Streptomyces sp. NPDC002922 TaxID=3154439 RepID=UPI0033B98839